MNFIIPPPPPPAIVSVNTESQPPLPDIGYEDEINEILKKKTKSRMRTFNDIINRIDLSNILNYSDPPPNELIVILETFQTCMTLHETGMIRLKSTNCNYIEHFLQTIIDDLKNENVHEDWYILRNNCKKKDDYKCKSTFRIILEIIREISENMNDYRNPIYFNKIELVLKTINTYEFLKDRLQIKDIKMGDEISTNYQCFLANTFSFDGSGNAIIAEERSKDAPIVTQKEKDRPPNPFAKKEACFTCEHYLQNCEQRLAKQMPNIIEESYNKDLSCEAKLKICKEKLSNIREKKIEQNASKFREVTQDIKGGRKTRRKKTKRAKKRKTRGKYKN